MIILEIHLFGSYGGRKKNLKSGFSWKWLDRFWWTKYMCFIIVSSLASHRFIIFLILIAITINHSIAMVFLEHFAEYLCWLKNFRQIPCMREVIHEGSNVWATTNCLSKEILSLILIICTFLLTRIRTIINQKQIILNIK